MKWHWHQPVTMRLAVLLACLLAVAALGGCSDKNLDPVITVRVKAASLHIAVPAKGEVVAAHSTVISVPGNARGPQTLAWLLAENSVVKKGDIVAKFDGESFIDKRQTTRLDLGVADQETRSKSLEIDSEKANIASDRVVVDKEIVFSGQFDVDDVTVYSKNEIIDALDNRQYLSARKDFLLWKMDNFSFSSANEMELMALRAQQYQTRLDQYDTALTQLDVQAPHDGILIYQKNWRGEKPRIGQTLWPGRKMARLPQLDKLNARVFVLESEAGNVAVGDQAQVVADAKPGVSFSGTVSNKANIAKRIKTGDPVKYFEIIVGIKNPDLSVIKPGNKVTAKLLGQRRENVLTLPLQAVFNDQDGSFVYLQGKDKFSKQGVTVGMKTFAEVEIKSGLTEGDRVALFQPGVL